MGHFKINEKDPLFILKDQLNYGSLCRLNRYQELDEETLDMLVTEALKFAKGVVEPLQEIGERWGVQFENGRRSLCTGVQGGLSALRRKRLDRGRPESPLRGPGIPPYDADYRQ